MENRSTSEKPNIEDFYIIQPWGVNNDEVLLRGALSGKTPGDEWPATVKSIAVDESVAVCVASLCQQTEELSAWYALSEPFLLRKKDSRVVKDGRGKEKTILVGEYIMRQPMIIFFIDFEADGIDSAIPTYLVCHPDFPAVYPKNLGKAEQFKNPIRTSDRPLIRR